MEVTQGIDATVAELNQLKADMVASAPGIAPAAPVVGAAVPAATVFGHHHHGHPADRRGQ